MYQFIYLVGASSPMTLVLVGDGHQLGHILCRNGKHSRLSCDTFACWGLLQLGHTLLWVPRLLLVLSTSGAGRHELGSLSIAPWWHQETIAPKYTKCPKYTKYK